MVKMYTRVYEFRPFSEKVTALRLGAQRRVDWIICVCVTGGVNPCPRRGVAYIECARTPAPLFYTRFNAHKGGALLVTSAVKCNKCP